MKLYGQNGQPDKVNQLQMIHMNVLVHKSETWHWHYANIWIYCHAGIKLGGEIIALGAEISP